MATEQDDQFLKGIGEQIEGYFPGLSEKIDELNYQQLGRGIVVGQGENKKLVGYILPLQANQEKHLVILKSGTIFIIQPNNPSEVSKEFYIKNFSPSPESSLFPFHNIQQIERHFIEDISLKITLQNNNPQHLPQIYEAMDQAISLARELKEKRDQAKNESAQEFIKKIDAFLNPPKKLSGENPMPPGQSQEPPKPQDPPPSNEPPPPTG